MGLTMSQRKAVTKTVATRYRRADKSGKGRILDELCATTGWHRNHARKALAQACTPRIVRPRVPRPPKYGPKVVAALIFCWAVLGMPAGKRLAPILPELVGVLRRFDELDIDDDTAALLASMSAATIDRRLAPERKKHELRGRSHTKPGSLLKSQIPIRTWADWDDAQPGFVEIDLVGHEGGNASGEHAYTLTVTDIATGWTENRSVRNKARKWVIAALDEIAKIMPFPILGVDSDNGGEFINHHLLAWCEKRKITFTRSRPGNSNDGCHVGAEELGDRAHRRRLPPLRLRSRTVAAQQDLGAAVAAGELLLPATETRLEGPQRREGRQEVRHGDHPTPSRRTPQSGRETRQGDPCRHLHRINPAAVQRQIQALTTELLTLTTSKAGPGQTPPLHARTLE
jgi:hypothetical protein